MNKKKVGILIAVLVAVLLIGVALGVYLAQVSLTQHAKVVMVGTITLWENAECTIPFATYDWGSALEPGQVLTKAMWLRNDGNMETLYLGWNSTGWTGVSGAEYYDGNFVFSMTQNGLAWGIGGTNLPLAKGAVLPLEMVLRVESTASGGAEINFVVTIWSYSTPTG